MANKIDFKPVNDPSNMIVQNVAPPDKSIYSNPTTQNLEVLVPAPNMKQRTPGGNQVGYRPDMLK